MSEIIFELREDEADGGYTQAPAPRNSSQVCGVKRSSQ